MAITNYDRVSKAMDLLRQGVLPFVERELQAQHGKYWITEVTKAWPGDLTWADDDTPHLDIAALLRIMWDQWNTIFIRTLGHTERSMVSELREYRNKWAHQEPFSSRDTLRVLDSAARLLRSVSAPEADTLERMHTELTRHALDEQMRSERRKSSSKAIESAVTGTLKPWREVITPHIDVASGGYQQAEFAADLWQVHQGEGTDEYRDPVEFFRRTYLTESLKNLLVGALQRFKGKGGDPVIQLQTNFGGGKTHSMLALYHMVSGLSPRDLTGVENVMQEAGVTAIPSAHRVVLVGNKISPGNPSIKADGTVVRTLWGEIAWQLGGREAYERLRLDDERATNPGDRLRELFNTYAPCLVLIDEWVAYARQLHNENILPAGSFETQFTFAQALTESARLAKQCLLVISLPASEPISPHSHADNVEVGGERGRESLDRLQNIVGRIESSWRPASAEESFEIVRRRLFEPMSDPSHFKDRDTVARAFADLYRTQHQEFPPESHDSAYEQRLRAAYPIHPEVFDRLYTDWSTLVKFQRTRGVLRLMAAVIHSLWEKGDRNPLIMPANIPIDQPRVQFELTRYLSDNWVPILEKDVDGEASLPMQLDRDVSNLGKYAACRRVARTVYLGSAPIVTAANRGMEDRRIKLGCVMPGEPPSVFGDALRRLATTATYLYQDGPRYWYSTQPTVTRLAEDRAEQLKRDPDKVLMELDRRLREDLKHMGDFNRVHPMPANSSDVPDDLDARLVVLTIEQDYRKGEENKAEIAARSILEMRGGTPRFFRNTLSFLAPDKNRVQDLDEAVRAYLAWDSIVQEKNILDLTSSQERQAETQRKNADETVTARIPEAYQWLLVPRQKTPQSPVEWEAIRLSGKERLAERASKKLRSDELLIMKMAPSSLRLEMDKIPLWRGGAHVAIRQLVEDFGRYHYLSRLHTPTVLLEAIRAGIGSLTWEHDTFAYAESYDEEAKRYRGLQAATHVSITEDDTALLVHPDVARRQFDAEAPPPAHGEQPADTSGETVGKTPASDGTGSDTHPVGEVRPRPKPRRFHGSITLDPARAGRDASKIADEVITHLVGLVGASVKVTLEIAAHVPDGTPDNVVRTVTENSRTLKFDSAGFEEE